MASFLLGEAMGRQELGLKINIPKRTVRITILTVSILIYAATFPVFFLLSSEYRGMVTAALLFSFPGVITRHILGTLFNSKIPSFPIGTFASNILATVITAVSYVLQHVDPAACDPTAFTMLQGLVDGYTACLSTVSTYAAEIHVMNRRHAWRYSLVSCVAAQVVLILVIGIAKWKVGLQASTGC
jgi:fluoride ion exporter CrcB/FEX